MYHYFSNLNHLTLFASAHYLKDYAVDLSQELPAAKAPLDAYLKVWECFCRRSYEQPEVYEMLFFDSYQELDMNEIFATYYEVFPGEIDEDILEYTDMLTESNIFRREFIALSKALGKTKYHLSEKEIQNICEMNILIYRDMLSSIRQNGPLTFSPEEAVSRTVGYMKTSLAAYKVVV